ncbi:MAG TPA: DUF4350 domain-containing protein [Gemmatimonadaceae bacterium]|nr:DUF4350 domain-containing protein [Gemmatimonadaceae bacterium]
MDRWLRPRYVFPVLALLVLAAVFLSPHEPEGARATHLTTYGTDPYAARGVYEVLRGLGFRVERRRTSFHPPLDTTAVYVLLDPPIDPSRTEVGELLDAVRHGARAVVVPSRGSPLADSLGMRQSLPTARDLDVEREPSADGAAPAERAVSVVAAAREVGGFGRYLVAVPKAMEDTAPVFPADTIPIVRVRRDSASVPAIMARHFGRGEVVAVADPSFFRNGTLRDGPGAVLAVRLMEYVGGTRPTPLVFDEYHHGFGMHGGPMSAVGRALFETAPGRGLVQLAAAALVLLLAYGVRPIAPTPRGAIERRSPLEHVGALSRAYEQVEATRLATRRLVRGLRRRHPLGASGAMDDETYLEHLSARKPEVAADAALLRTALGRRLPPAEWVAVGGAIDHIERTITQ